MGCVGSPRPSVRLRHRRVGAVPRPDIRVGPLLPALDVEVAPTIGPLGVPSPPVVSGIKAGHADPALIAGPGPRRWTTWEEPPAVPTLVLPGVGRSLAPEPEDAQQARQYSRPHDADLRSDVPRFG